MPAGADPHSHSAPPSRAPTPHTNRRHKISTEEVRDSSSDIVADTSPSAPNSPDIELDAVGSEYEEPKTSLTTSGHMARHWTKKRVWLLVIAVTLHNIPEGIVLGVAYGSIVGENSENKNGPSLKDAILLTVALGSLQLDTLTFYSMPLVILHHSISVFLCYSSSKYS